MECLGPIAEALSVAHGQEQRIAHRDIKPANIFLAETDEGPLAKLLDFGIAKVMNATGEGAYNATTVGAIAGFTPMYAAPEQWKKSFGATGPWTDVYALALVCVEMMTGKTALSGDDALQLMAATVDPRNRPTPRGRGVMVSSRVEAVFRKALAIEAKDRYANAQEFWGDLQKAGSAGAGTGRRALELGAGVFGVLIAAGTFWGLMRWQDRKPVEIPRDAGVVLVNLVDAGAELDGGVEQVESPVPAAPLKLESSAAPVPKPSVVAAAKVIGAKAVEGKDGGVELDAGEAVEEVDDGTDPYDPEPVKEFDQNAANAATQSAANAVGVGCARAGGPSGAGTVKLIFEPTGEVSSVTLLDAAFEGTEVGACILRRFGAIRVPPFGGASRVGTKGFWVKEVEGVPAPPPEPAPVPGGD